MATDKLVATNYPEYQNGKDLPSKNFSSGKFAAHPVIGWIMFIFGALVFGALLLNLTFQGPLLPWDRSLATSLPAFGLQHQAVLKPVMDAGYYLGGWGVISLTVIFGLYFILKKYWQALMMLWIGMAGESLLFLAVSNLVGRPRPPTQMWIILKIPGFPSGHSMAVVVIFGLLAYLLVPKIRNAVGKGFLILLAILLVLFVGFTRVFTAAHYLTDVLAGYALGIAWSGVVYTLIEIYFKKRRSHNVKKG